MYMDEILLAELWNKMPDSMKKSGSGPGFREALKRQLMSSMGKGLSYDLYIMFH